MNVATAPACVHVWALPLAPVTLAEMVSTVSRLIREGRPSLVITANTHYAMLCESDADLREINERAALIVADGKPLVWASRLAGTPLPERVAGSDLIFPLCEEAARQSFRVFLLGGGEGVAEAAALRLTERYPDLQIVGTLSPPFRDLSPQEHEALIAEIHAASPDLLLTAFTMPRGERWLAAHLEALAVPVVMNVGAAIDFVAGRVRRAPVWMQKSGLEWLFRLGLEPRRLASRYARNAWFILRKAASTKRVKPATIRSIDTVAAGPRS